MRLFGSDRLTGVVEALGLEDDQPIEHRMLTNAIEMPREGSRAGTSISGSVCSSMTT